MGFPRVCVSAASLCKLRRICVQKGAVSRLRVRSLCADWLIVLSTSWRFHGSRASFEKPCALVSLAGAEVAERAFREKVRGDRSSCLESPQLWSQNGYRCAQREMAARLAAEARRKQAQALAPARIFSALSVRMLRILYILSFPFMLSSAS
eukprot:6184715-Pleurochrysis_carterae.AAC.1